MTERDNGSTINIDMPNQRPELYPATVLSRPKVAYSEIFDTIEGHKDISYEDRIQVKALDIMVEAIRHEPGLVDQFDNFTLGDKSRLTDKRNPNYGRDLLMSVHTPDEFFVRVFDRAKVNIDENGWAIGTGLMKRWGQAMESIAEESDSDQLDEVEAKKLVRRLLVVEEKVFALDTVPSLV